MAPVQVAMWRARRPGLEMEQMVLEFREGIREAPLKSAWDQTVHAPEVLRMPPLRDQSGKVVGLSLSGGNVPWKVVKDGAFTTWLAAGRLEVFTDCNRGGWRASPNCAAGFGRCTTDLWMGFHGPHFALLP